MKQLTFDNSRWRTTAWLLVLAVGLTCCGTDRAAQEWKDELLEADRERDLDETDAAEERYRSLLEEAPGDDDERHVLLELAAIDEERGAWDKALERYERVYAKERDDEQGARAMYRSGLIRLDEFGHVDEGLELLEETIRRYPASVSAEFAVERIARHFADADDFAAMTARLESLYAELSDEPIADNILFSLAERLEVDADDADAALPYYRRLYTDHTNEGMADDALWQAARIYHRRQQWTDALELYERLAERTETSWFVGTYNSPWANDARFELGRVHMLFLDDYESAIAHFERYLDDFPQTTDADDAAWHIAHAYRLMGDREAFEAQLDRLAEEFPDSRHVRAADELLEEAPKR